MKIFHKDKTKLLWQFGLLLGLQAVRVYLALAAFFDHTALCYHLLKRVKRGNWSTQFKYCT